MPARAIGIVVLVVILVAGFAAFEKDEITTAVNNGDTIQAEFSRGYKLDNYRSDVRVADVQVGKVTDVESTDHGTVLVTMKVKDDIRDVLGRSPSAAIRPTTLLGGVYYVALTPGGAHGTFAGPIPVARTSVPVELGEVLSALTPPARQGVQSSVSRLDATLHQGGKDAARSLIQDAPGTLRPTGDVLNAALGTRPETDLTGLVSGLRNTAAVLNRTDGQLDAIFTDLNRSTGALAAERQPLSGALANLPATLRTTRTGLGDLHGTLDRLISTATSLQPTARSLDSLLGKLDPVLDRTRPVVSETRDLVGAARPLVQELVPTVDSGTQDLANVRGPVLDRLNGPIKDLVLSPWKGTGVYAGGGNGHRFYEEVGYLGVNGAKVFQTHDGNGAQGRLMAGVGARTLGGAAVPMSLEQYLETLGLEQPLGPQEDANSGHALLPQFPIPPEEPR
jgi:phospholipid/cholesterol/gamma-HCH transport system substrate-binding protein